MLDTAERIHLEGSEKTSTTSLERSIFIGTKTACNSIKKLKIANIMVDSKFKNKANKSS